jgi:transcriptional regulator with XRE-family HTH domain
MWIAMDDAIHSLPVTTIVVTHLPEIAKKVREIRGLTITAAAKQIGISGDTLRRYEAKVGGDPSWNTMMSVLAWASTFTAPAGRVEFNLAQIAQEAEEAKRV